MSKKQFPLWAKITLLTTSVVLSTGLGIGTSIAYKYEGLLDTFFSSSDYVAKKNKKVINASEFKVVDFSLQYVY